MNLLEDLVMATGTITIVVLFISIILICLIALFDKVFSYWLFNKYDRETIWKVIRSRNEERNKEKVLKS